MPWHGPSFLHTFCQPCKLFLAQADNLVAVTSYIPLGALQPENEQLREVFSQVWEGAFLLPRGLTQQTYPREGLEVKVWTTLQEYFAVIFG